MPNSSDRLEAAIERFCAHLSAENKAAGTVTAYRRDLRLVACVVNGHLKVHHYGHLKVHHFKSGF